jgi:hypothetical protein
MLLLPAAAWICPIASKRTLQRQRCEICQLKPAAAMLQWARIDVGLMRGRLELLLVCLFGRSTSEPDANATVEFVQTIRAGRKGGEAAKVEWQDDIRQFEGAKITTGKVGHCFNQSHMHA